MAAVMLFLRQSTGKTERYTHFCMPLKPVFTRDCGDGVHFTDEPTGSVDTATADYIFDLFAELNKNGQTILIVTHDVALSKRVRRVVAIRDGKISSEKILKEAYRDRIRESSINWREEETQDEYVIMDKAGRIQIPRELAGMLRTDGNKVKVELQDGKVILSGGTRE